MNEQTLQDQISDLMQQERWRDVIVRCESSPASAMNLETQWNWAWAHFKVEEFSTARLLFENLLERHSERPATLLGLGVVLQRLGNADESKRNLERALQLKDSTLARLSLALIYMEKGDFASAERIHLEGLQLRPKSIERLEAYADFLSDTGRDDEAALQHSKSKMLRSCNG